MTINEEENGKIRLLADIDRLIHEPARLLSLTAGGRQAFRTYRHRMKRVLDELPE